MPDSIVMTGHMGPEVNVGDLLVTVGGVQKRLGDALLPPIASLPAGNLVNALTDLAAKAAGVPVGGLYRTGNTLMVRLA